MTNDEIPKDEEAVVSFASFRHSSFPSTKRIYCRMTLLVQFLLRLTFGMTAAMALTSPRQISSGYYRNNLYVALGLMCFATLLAKSAAPGVFWITLGTTVLCYVGTICWLYEKPLAGRVVLGLIAALALLAAGLASGPSVQAEGAEKMAELLRQVAPLGSGMLLGTTMAAMLLGHWYLNSPTMELAPLRRLILVMVCAVVLQAILSAVGLWLELSSPDRSSELLGPFLILRWAFGLLGVGGLAWMAWQTLKIPNTQSATGILYVAVIGTFVGETMALLLSSGTVFPL